MFDPIFPTTSFTKSFGDSFTVPTSAPFGLGGMTLGVAAVLETDSGTVNATFNGATTAPYQDTLANPVLMAN